MKPYIYIYSIILILFSCERGNYDINNCNADDQKLYEMSEFPIGVGVGYEELFNNQMYEKLVNDQFNSISPGNIFKAEYLQPYHGFFYWDQADRLIDYCVENKKEFHGHTLIWHDQQPDWMLNFDGGEKEWEEIFKTHIQTVCKKYKGKVKGWDVVNEAFNDDGTLRNTIWRKNLGNSYIEKAFIYAHEADPDAKLFYNDYNLSYNEKKRNAVLKYLIDLKKRGIPIDGIGLQMHISIRHPENNQISETFKQCYETGLLVRISELDISVNQLGHDIEPTNELFERQAEKLIYVVSNYKNIPKNQQYGITFWGVGDADSWIRTYFNREDYPLLFDDYYKPKPAYCRLIEIL